MRNTLFLMMMLAAAPASAAPPANACARYIDQIITPVPIADVFDGLPTVAPRDAYESTSDYQKRLDRAARAAPMETIVIDRPWGGDPPTYNPDKGVLPIYPNSLGVGALDFGSVLRTPLPDSFGGIGFEVTRKVTGRSTYEANNGFGAKVIVQHRDEQSDVIWEGSLKLGESPFPDSKGFRPVITLSLDPARARDIVEQGGSALVVMPKPPFRQDGQTALAPSFNVPSSYTRKVRVLWADVRCALIYDGSKKVVAALMVK